MERRIIAYAHQGGAWEAPSSTLYAMRRALEAGATALELDLHATADGELVVCHDPTVDRTTNGTGAIAALTLADLRKLDNAYWFIAGADVTPGRPDDEYPFRGRAPDDPDFRISTLREVLESFPDVLLNLDIKQSAPVVAPYEVLVANALEEFGRTDDVIVTSFLDPVIDAFAAAAPNVPTSVGAMGTAAFWQSVHTGNDPPALRAVALQVPERRGDLVVVDERFVEAAHRHGFAVHVWTINNTQSMERLVDLGVDGIMSDLPTELVSVLGSAGVAWAGLPPR